MGGLFSKPTHNDAPVSPSSKAAESPRGRRPITADDVVTIQGTHLYVGQERFFVKGIAFPSPPPAKVKHTGGTTWETDGDDQVVHIDLGGWNAVLEQLATETDINTVRMYDMDCRYDYSPFLERAAELGIYVIVPFTAVQGNGVLSRDSIPPTCYPSKLFDYGKTCVESYWKHPNVLAGVVGNEVMNNLLAWKSAPCVRAYLEDLQAYAHAYGLEEQGKKSNKRPAFPFMYATQHDSPSAELLPDEATKVTLDYLSCIDNESVGGGGGDPGNFIFGVNIESWCSSLQSFEYEEDGITESSYHSLQNTLIGHNKTKIKKDAVGGTQTTMQVAQIAPKPMAVPVMFSEMGCPKDLFNHDNSIEPKLVRDWTQIPLLVPHEGGGPTMTDVFSGFVAYGYDGGGSPKFRMMGGNNTKWDGIHVLPTSPEFENFRQQLSLAVAVEKYSDFSTNKDDSIGNKVDLTRFESCSKTIELLKDVWGLTLYPMSDMPSYFNNKQKASSHLSSTKSTKLSSEIIGGSHQGILRAGDGANGADASMVPMLIVAMLLAAAFVALLRRPKQQDSVETPLSSSSSTSDERANLKNYDSISSS